MTAVWYLDNKSFRVNHPDLLNGIRFSRAFFAHGRHQQMCRANGSLTQALQHSPVTAKGIGITLI